MSRTLSPSAWTESANALIPLGNLAASARGALVFGSRPDACQQSSMSTSSDKFVQTVARWNGAVSPRTIKGIEAKTRTMSLTHNRTQSLSGRYPRSSGQQRE